MWDFLSLWTSWGEIQFVIKKQQKRQWKLETKVWKYMVMNQLMAIRCALNDGIYWAKHLAAFVTALEGHSPRNGTRPISESNFGLSSSIKQWGLFCCLQLQHGGSETAMKRLVTRGSGPKKCGCEAAEKSSLKPLFNKNIKCKATIIKAEQILLWLQIIQRHEHESSGSK